MKQYNLDPGDNCPDCGASGLINPEEDCPMLPPTGGDFEYVDSQPVWLHCTTCGNKWETDLVSRYWLDTGATEYSHRGRDD